MALKEPQPLRLDIYNADVRIISGCSETTAARKILLCKLAYDKKDFQALTIKEYCLYYDYNYQEVLKQLQLI